MTRIKVENKSRKQTVKVRTATSNRAIDWPQELLSHIGSIEAESQKLQSDMKRMKDVVSRVDMTSATRHTADMESIADIRGDIDRLNFRINDLSERLQLLETTKLDIDAMPEGKAITRLAWGLWIVFALFVVVFGIVLN